MTLDSGVPAPFRFGLAAGGVFVSNDENIRITALNSLAGVRLALEARLLSLEGTIETIRVELVPTSDRVASSAIAGMREGWLLMGHVRPLAGAPRRGQCYARVEIVRGRTGDVQPIATLGGGYVTETSSLVWPGAPCEDSAAGRGVIRSITGTDPAAGVEPSDTVPTNARWGLMAWRARLVADATVATRTPQFIIDDGTTIVWRWDAGTSATASTSRDYHAGVVGYASPVSISEVSMALPAGLVLPGGYRIRTLTSGLQAGDNWGAPQLLVEEWIED